MPGRERGRQIDVLAGGGELGALLRAIDWTSNPLGPPGTWPQSLKAAVRIMLTSQQPIWVGWGPDLIYLYNDAYKSIIGGRHPTALAQPTLDVWHELRSDIEPLLKTAMREGEGTYVEEQLLIMERNGYPEETYYTFSYSPIPDEDGRPGGIICANTDDTSRVIGKRQAALLSTLSSSMTDATSEGEACERGAAALAIDPQDLPFAAIYLEGEQGFELVATQGVDSGSALAPPHIRAGDIYAGRPVDPAALTGPLMIEGIAPLVDPAAGEPWQRIPDHAALLPITAAGQRGLLITGLSPVRLFEGDYRDFLILVAGQIGTAIAAVRLRLAAANEIRASELRLRRLFDNAPGFIAILSGPDLRFEFANQSYVRMFGDRDYVGKPFVELFPEPRPQAMIRRVFESGERHRGTAASIALESGRDYTLDFIVEAIRDADGNITGIFLEGHDVSDRRRAEDELRELNETLERRIADALAERELAEEALRQSQKMEAVGQLTGGVAHDFNNLLTIITGNMDMVSRSLDRGDEARARRAVENAQKGAERAASLTQRLLAFSRRQPLAPKPIDTDRLVAGMSDLLGRALGETVRLEIVTNPGLWKVEVDPNQLENCILNLAVNARDAMPSGGKLAIETANARLDEAYTAAQAEVAPGHYVVIAVSDTGTGMSREVLARVFEPFFTTKEVGRGTGLGLSMVYGFVKQSGGHVKIYSEEGSGTTIKIYLPRLLRDAEPEEEGAEARHESFGHDEVILVAEDDDDVRAYTVEILRELGYHVLEAQDGPAALRIIERPEQAVDLLFTDVVMPGMSGSELADHARVIRPELKVLYTSGYTRNAIVHNGRLDAGVEMIAKPFTYQALAARVRDMLDSVATRRVLLATQDAGQRLALTDLLGAADHASDEAANRAEALGKLRAAGRHYRAVVIDGDLPDGTAESLVDEIRAMHREIAILVIASHERAAARFSEDRCTLVLVKPYAARDFQAALAKLGARCGKEEPR